ncbi:hypothetical protein, partial [Actinomyces sp. ZJ308]|uniref:hypothetical protein n=1 Tax=Actinomyces sp. ZJ308 TaxID=2708342 RepID=UPI001AB03329
PRRVGQCLQGHPRGSLAQLIGVLLLSHDSDPSVSSLPPSNPGRFNRLFEAPPGWVPPIGTNPGLRVSYDPAEGFGFWADERLECAWCVSDWMVDDGYELRSVDRSVFEGVIQRHGHRLGKDDWLESVAFCLLPVQETSSQEAGGESFFHGSMRFKPGEGFMRAADDVLRPESQ